jgi:hypothetical protein
MIASTCGLCQIVQPPDFQIIVNVDLQRAIAESNSIAQYSGLPVG